MCRRGLEISLSSTFFIFYILLNASIGLKFAAFIDGSNPNTIPITVEKITAPTAAGTLMTIGVPDIFAIMAARAIPPNTPRMPPIPVSYTHLDVYKRQLRANLVF